MRAPLLVVVTSAAALVGTSGLAACSHEIEPLFGDELAPPGEDPPHTHDPDPDDPSDPPDDPSDPPDDPSDPPDDPSDPPDDPSDPPDDPSDPPDDPSDPPDDPSDPPDDPSDPGDPGELPPDLECLDHQALNSRNMSGSALRDIVRHLPNDQVDYYCDPDLVTCAHEVSHGIHAYLRNYENPNSEPSNAFYLLHDRACFVVEPGIWKHEVVPYVPSALREFRFSTYVSGQSAWDDTPLYLWDEWNAYVNGGEAAISLYDEGLWNEGWRDQSGVIEFVAYGLAVGLAVEELDPSYFASDAQFTAMLAYFTRRSLDLHRRFADIDDFQFSTSDELYQTLRTSSAAAPLREFLIRTWGQQFHDEALDL
jgi:hypothetical protein